MGIGMPIYDYSCPNCGTVENVIAGMSDKTLVHEKCKGIMKRFISGNKGISMGPAGAYGYFDDNLQTFINTNKQHREECKKQGVTPKLGKGWY